jgi:hypothetical protein
VPLLGGLFAFVLLLCLHSIPTSVYSIYLIYSYHPSTESGTMSYPDEKPPGVEGIEDIAERVSTEDEEFTPEEQKKIIRPC